MGYALIDKSGIGLGWQSLLRSYAPDRLCALPVPKQTSWRHLFPEERLHDTALQYRRPCAWQAQYTSVPGVHLRSVCQGVATFRGPMAE